MNVSFFPSFVKLMWLMQNPGQCVSCLGFSTGVPVFWSIFTVQKLQPLRELGPCSCTASMTRPSGSSAPSSTSFGSMKSGEKSLRGISLPFVSLAPGGLFALPVAPGARNMVSGLAIRDAVTLERSRLTADNRLFLYAPRREFLCPARYQRMLQRRCELCQLARALIPRISSGVATVTLRAQLPTGRGHSADFAIAGLKNAGGTVRRSHVLRHTSRLSIWLQVYRLKTLQ
jgi:hypothetical protein